MTDHLRRYENWIDYDVTFVRGRVVSAYDPVQHCWRPRLAYELGLAYVPPSDPDAAMDFEPEPLEHKQSSSMTPNWLAAQQAMRERSATERQKIADLLREVGTALSRAQIANHLGKPRHWVENNLPHVPGVVCVGRDSRQAKLFTIEDGQ